MGLTYRTDEEVNYWKGRDPIKLLEKRLADQSILSEGDAHKVHDEVAELVRAGVKFAEDSPMPDPEALLQDVYA
jgi:pyruvate dehydrogenase E1 component alpha subunit